MSTTVFGIILLNILISLKIGSKFSTSPQPSHDAGYSTLVHINMGLRGYYRLK
jgi:hypothetical protein